MIKKASYISCLFLILFFAESRGQDISHYFGTDLKFNKNIPTPKQVLGFNIGEWHLTNDQLLWYFYELEHKSDNIKIQEIGFTYEQRKQIIAIISARENLDNLEKIRTKRLDYLSGKGKDNEDIPGVAWLGYGIHGNEPSGSNASTLVAYYLLASENPHVKKFLSENIVIIDPSQNPDGMQRFASWVNSNKSKNLVGDRNNREFREPWPRGRTNHYWFDLNRDWLLAQHPESRNRLNYFHQWMPNIFTDHHEMGEESTFFFQPGVPDRVNPLISKGNQSWTSTIAQYHVKSFDSLGIRYFSKEQFDDFYFGKGSTYPDLHGAVGILFEQGSSRGHLRETRMGEKKFSETVKNQLLVSLSTLKSLKENSWSLNAYQRNYYLNQSDEAKRRGGAILLKDDYDKMKLRKLTNILDVHHIKYHVASSDNQNSGTRFSKQHALAIPFDQQQYPVIKALFDRNKSFKDSLFYDVSAWSLDLAFNLDSRKLDNSEWKQIKPSFKDEKIVFSHGQLAIPKTGYLIAWDQYNAPAFAYQLLSEGIKVLASESDFTSSEGQEFTDGTLFIPVQGQSISSGKLVDVIKHSSDKYAVEVISTNSAQTKTGNYLGSSTFKSLKKPSILLMAGDGISSYRAGEFWHLLDFEMDISVTLMDPVRLQNTSLSKYNVIIFPDGNYQFGNEKVKNELLNYSSNGGVLIAQGKSINALKAIGLSDVTVVNGKSSIDKVHSYADLRRAKGAKRLGGAIFETQIDPTHPLCFGINDTELPVFKNNTMAFEKKNNVVNPITYKKEPVLEGYVHSEVKGLLNEKAGVHISSKGKGVTIAFADGHSFRGYWYGTKKLLFNGIFFGHLIQTK